MFPLNGPGVVMELVSTETVKFAGVLRVEGLAGETLSHEFPAVMDALTVAVPVSVWIFNVCEPGAAVPSV